MLVRLAHLLVRRARSVLAGTLVLLALAAVLGVQATSRLKSGGFTDPASDSSRAASTLAQHIGGDPDLLLLVTGRPAQAGGVDAPAVAAAGRDLTARLRASAGVTQVASWWTTGAPTLRSRDRTAALVVAHVAGGDDYEVFLLARISELHEAGASTTESVAGGLARTGRIVSTAAALLAVTFVAFGTSHVTFIQLFGIGTGIAIVIDATLVRGVLVPAFMRVAGDASWWSPAPLRRVHRRVSPAEA